MQTLRLMVVQSYEKKIFISQLSMLTEKVLFFSYVKNSHSFTHFPISRKGAWNTSSNWASAAPIQKVGEGNSYEIGK
jgi:hypothetical protein